MEKTTSVINGVNLKRLSDIITLIYAQPELAHFNFRLSNQWVDGGYNQSVIKDFYGAGGEDTTRETPFIVSNDEPEVLLGTDLSPNPLEFLLHALAGCITTSMVYHAAAHGYKIDGIKTSLEGNLDLKGFLGLDGDIRPGFKEIHIRIDLDGDLTDQQKEEIVQFGSSFSPVFDMVTTGVPVRLSMNKKTSPAEAA